MGLEIIPLVLVLLTQLVQSDQVVGTYNLMLDPGRIYWWKTKWTANPIDLTKSNAGATGVSITFNFNPSTSLTNGIFEVTFPSTFTVSGATGNVVSVSSQVVQVTATYLANVDTSITIGSITLPSSFGGYGPFALISRYASGGQIIDSNMSFGNIYVTAAATTLTSASVSYVPNMSTSVINKSGNTLSFKFVIGANLWKHDIFKITVDYRFTVVMGNNYVCNSMDYSGYVNNFNGTSTSNPHTLDCVATAKTSSSTAQVVWIYGLSTTLIDTSQVANTFVNLYVPGITNPSSSWPSASYNWIIETVRFGTTNTLQQVTVTGPTTTADVLGSVTWVPTWGMSTTSIITGMNIFMQITFVVNNPVPASGQVVIVTTEGSATWGAAPFSCVVLTDIGKGRLCSMSSGTMTITGFNALAASASVTARYLASFTTTQASGNPAKITSITTSDASTNTIDSSSFPVSINIPGASAATLLANFGVYFQTDNTGATLYTKAGGTGTTGLYVAFLVNAGIVTSSTVNIYCPLSSALDDFQIYIPTGFTTTSNTNLAALNGGNGVQLTTGTVTTATVTQVPGSITVPTSGLTTYTPGSLTFTATSAMTSFTFGLGLYMTGTSYITLPRVVSNIMTAYECRIEATGASNTILRGVSQFTITGQTLTPTVSYFCQFSQASGIPLQVTVLPTIVDLYASSSTKTYYLEIDLPSAQFPTAFHGSGVVEGGQYPMDSSLSSGATMTISSTTRTAACSNAHIVTGLGNLSISSTAASIVFPVTSVGAVNTFAVTVHTYYILANDNLLTKYFTHADNTSPTYAVTGVGVPASTGTVVSITSGTSVVTNSNMGSTPLTLSANLTPSPISANSYFYIIFPRGFSFSALKDVQSSYPSAGSSFPVKRYFSSPNAVFAFPGILVQAAYNGAQIYTTATTISIFGVNTPLGSNGAGSFIVVHGDLSGATANACYSRNPLTLNTSVGSIATLTVSPSVIQSLGPNGVDIAQTIIVVLPDGIDQGGTIVFTLGTQWTLTTGVTTCTVSGLSPIAGATSVPCTWLTNTFTIASFLDFSTVTGNTITIYINHLLPPAGSTSSLTYQFVTAFDTYGSSNLSSAKIDTYAPAAGSIVTILPTIAQGYGTFQASSILPPNAGALTSDLYVKFYMNYALPVGSVITIGVPYTLVSTGAKIQNRCWLSPLTISNCAIASGIALTLGTSYQALSVLELFVRRAVTTPSTVPTVASATQYPFSISAAWQGASVITDPGKPYQSAQLVYPTVKLVAAITGSTPAITFSPTNAGEMATYVFNFKLSINFAATDILYVHWPEGFDPYVGDAQQLLTQDPGNYYLTCSSTAIGSPLWCKIDHWVMVITGSGGTVNAGTVVDITVAGVNNPPAGISSSFRVSHYDQNTTLLEFTENLGAVTTIAPPGNIGIRLLSSSSRNLVGSADISMILYPIDSFGTATNLQVRFPKEYDLSLIDQKDQYTCATQWVDFLATALITTPQEWNSAASCTASGNLVTLSAPTTTKNFLATNYVTWNVTSVTTPMWGYPRTPASAFTDFDIQDWSVWTVYSYWTHKFDVFIYQGASTSQSYSSRSYGQANSAYLGFMQPLRTVQINSYSPLDRSNRIVVWPGTQTSDLSITTANSTWPLEAKNLTFTPSTNSRTPDGGNLKYTSFVSNFVMMQEEWTINFRVAASITATKGLYSVNWKLTEVTQPGVPTTGRYVTPPPTLVEIAPLVTGKYQFTVAPIPAVTVGGTSIPILVSLTNAPYVSVVVNIAIQTINTVVVNPSTLNFQPDVNSLYFYISVNATHDVSTYPSVVAIFSLTGTDAAAFSIAPAALVPIQTSSPYSSQGTISKIGISSITRTSVSIAPTTDQLGVLYYILQPKGSAILSSASIKALIPTFIKTPADISAQQTANSKARAAIPTDPNSGETWNQFQIRLYKAHVTSFQSYGSIAMSTTVTNTPIVINGLWAQTSYQIVAYLDILNGNSTGLAIRTEFFDTLATADCQPVYVRFRYDVADTFLTTIFNTLAKYLGVNPTRLVSQLKTSEKSSRLLQTSTNTTTSNSTSTLIAFTVFTATILPNRALNTPTPTQASVLSNEAVNNMQNDFIAAGISNQMWNYGPLAIPTRNQPLWNIAPEISTFTNVSITVDFLSTVAGQSCCVALSNVNINYQPEQLYWGYDYNWTSAISQCITSNISQSLNYLTLSGLSNDTNYYVQCVATDDYPLFPTQMTYTSTLPIPFIPIHTPYTIEVVSELSAANNLYLLLGLLALLIH